MSNVRITSTYDSTLKNILSGCKSKLKSSLLHYHEQTSLLEKVCAYFPETRGTLIAKLDNVFTEFAKKMPGECTKADRELYISNGRSFLFVMTPEGLYYGRYKLYPNILYWSNVYHFHITSQ